MRTDLKIVISGYGKMGKMVEKELKDKAIECAGITEDIESFDKSLSKECVCIDFTTPDSFKKNYRFLAENFKAVVVGTTGWYDIKEEIFGYFEKCGTPMIWASNYSVGVNLMTAAVEMLSSKFGKIGGYSPYIIEKHHIHKIDAPSGTAKTLAKAIETGFPGKTEVLSLRVGEIPGIHTVCFEGKNERLTIEHEAFSRQGFAEGAVAAALMTQGLAGVYEFKDLFLK